MTASYVIVIGGGHNGLTLAGYLARAGKRVSVLERRAIPGGLAAREEFHPGYTAPGLWLDTHALRPKVVADLELERHGLELMDEEAPLYCARTDGPGLFIHRDVARTASELAAISQKDADAWPRFWDRIERVRGFVDRLVNEPAPDPDAESTGALWELLKSGIALRRLGEEDMTELLRLAPMCVADWLNEWFESPLLKGALAAQAVQGTWLGPWSSGSAAQLLVQCCTRYRSVRGGPAALTDALVACARAAGVGLRTASEVESIVVDGGRVRGVQLGTGEILEADVVAASCDPRRTFLELLHPRKVSDELETRARNWRVRGTTAAVRLALDGRLELASAATPGDGRHIERAQLVLELDELERAFDAVKYGSFSAVPHLDIWIPSRSNPGLAPEGGEVVCILVHFVPYQLDDGWTDERRSELEKCVLETLERHAPGTGARVRASEVLTPLDLEQRYALTGGHVHHGEHALDQMLFMRPNPDCARYATPIPGLFLCGSGSHPGGGITGAPGLLASRAILEK